MNPRLQIVLAALLFSTGGAAIKWVGTGAWQVAGFRAGIAGLTLLALIPAARRGWSWRTVLVGLTYGATTLLYVQANRNTTAASTIFLQNTNPLFILVLAPWALGERATRRDLAQMAVMALGMILFFVGLDRPTATAPNPALGNALALTCAATWAVTVIGYRWLAARGASIAPAATAGNLTACVVALTVASPLAPMPAADWAVLGFLGVFQLGVPYLFMTRAIPRLRALEISMLLLMEPVVNPIWAWLLHGETPGFGTIAGGTLILGATVGRAVTDARS